MQESNTQNVKNRHNLKYYIVNNVLYNEGNNGGKFVERNVSKALDI